MITMSSFKYAGLIISIIISLISCTHNKNYPTAFQPELAKAEAMMYRYPDSALHILQGIQPDIPSENEQYATWALLMTQAQYKNQIEQSDSLINIAYSYFTKHDNAQRKALALYYKGILRHESHHAEDALSFYLEAATEIEKTNDYQLGFLINSEVGLMYLYRKLNDYAMDYFEKLLDNDYLIEPICQELIFANCFDEADQIAQKTNIISSASLSRIKADYLFTNNRLDEALPYILEALKEINSDALKYNLASIYEKNIDFDNANILFHEIIENYELKDDEPFDFVLAHTEALKHLNISNFQYLRCLEPYVQDNCGAFTLLLKFALDHDLYDYQDYLLNDVNHVEPESDSEYIFYMMILLDIHLEHKRYEMVVDIFDHIPKEYQTYFLTHKLKALYQLEDYEGVIGMYDDVMPDGYNAIIILKACLKLERYSVSNRLFNDMLQVDPEKVEGKKIFWEYAVDHVDPSFNLE